jgi:hypothetical protein
LDECVSVLALTLAVAAATADHVFTDLAAGTDPIVDVDHSADIGLALGIVLALELAFNLMDITLVQTQGLDIKVDPLTAPPAVIGQKTGRAGRLTIRAYG